VAVKCIASSSLHAGDREAIFTEQSGMDPFPTLRDCLFTVMLLRFYTHARCVDAERDLSLSLTTRKEALTFHEQYKQYKRP